MWRRVEELREWSNKECGGQHHVEQSPFYYAEIIRRACISGEQRQMLSSNMSFSMASKNTLTALKRAVITTSRVVSGVTKGFPAQCNILRHQQTCLKVTALVC